MKCFSLIDIVIRDSNSAVPGRNGRVDANFGFAVPSSGENAGGARACYSGTAVPPFLERGTDDWTGQKKTIQ